MIGRGPWRRRTPAVLVLVAAATVLGTPLLSAPPAPADLHPSDGAVLGTAPGAVQIGLPGPAPAEVHVGVTDEHGTTVTDGPAGVDGAAVRQPLRSLPPGGYRVTYHVTLADGGQLAGVTVFRVGGAGTTKESAAAPAGGGHLHGAGIDPLTGVVLGANVVVALGIAVAESRRRRRRRGTGTREG